MKPFFVLVSLLILVYVPLLAQNRSPATNKPRTIIITDGEVDDVDTFVRMLLYSNEFDVVGLVYSSSSNRFCSTITQAPFICKSGVVPIQLPSGSETGTVSQPAGKTGANCSAHWFG